MKNIQTIIIAVLALVILWLSQCQRVAEPVPPVVEYKYIHDTTYVPKLVYEDTTIYSVIYQDSIVHDTVKLSGAVVQYISPTKDWYTQRKYVDTIEIDTIGWMVITDMIYQNKIKMRMYDAHVRIRPMQQPKLDKPSSNGLYWGGSTTLSSDGFKSLTAELLYIRRDAGYLIGAGIGDDFKYRVRLGIYFKF